MEKHIQTPAPSGIMQAVTITRLFNKTIKRLCLAGSMPHKVIDGVLTFDEDLLKAWILTDEYKKAVLAEEEELEAFSKF